MELRRTFNLKITEEVVLKEEEDSNCWTHQDLPSDVQKVIVGGEEQQERSSSLDQDQEQPEPPHIKEEQEELWIGQEGEQQLQGLQEADITKFTFTPVPVKSEDDGEDCGGPEPDRISDPDGYLQPVSDDQTGASSEHDTDDSGDWEETREPQSGSNSLKNDVVPVSEKPFSCSECGKRFVTNGSVKRHMRTHTGEKPFSCSVCNRSFTQSGHLKVHMSTHTREKPVSCSVCGKRFLVKYYLVQHMRTHTAEELFISSVCDKGFIQAGSLTHMIVHTGDKRFGCSICDRRFAQLYHLKIHKCLGGQSSLFHQTEENLETEPPASSSTEQMETEADGEDCGEPEPDRNSDPDTRLMPVADIKTEPSSETEDSVDMEFWKETRKHQSGFTYQRNKKVSGLLRVYPTFTFSCSDDEAESEPKTEDRVYGAGQPQSGPNHLKTEDVSVSISSSEWHQTPDDSHTLLTHKSPPAAEKPFSESMSCHTEEKPFHCSVCSAGFSDSEALVQHMRIHTRQTQFRCRICGQEFAWRRYLTKHMEVHITQKNYDCSICGKTFAWLHHFRNHRCVAVQPSQLQSHAEVEPPASSSALHIKTEADGEDCGGPGPDGNSDPDTHLQPDAEDWEDWKETREPQSGLNSLNNDEVPVSDLISAADEKPFSCSQCGKRFGCKGSVKRHMTTHTGEKPFGCSVCKRYFTRNGSIKIHMRTHTGEKPFSCSVCDQRFAWLKQLRNHKCVGVQSSQLHTEPPACSSALHMETGADGEDCGGPEPHRDSDPDTHFNSGTEVETGDSSGPDESRDPQSGLNSLNNGELPVSDSKC